MTNQEFPFEIAERVEIEMPVGAAITGVQMIGLVNERPPHPPSYGSPVICAMVEPGEAVETRRFYCLKTGAVIPAHERLYFVGTIQVLNGRCLYHVFVQGEI